MRAIWRWMAGTPAYLWSGWGAMASLLLGMALWELLAAYYGPLILPTPMQAAQTLALYHHHHDHSHDRAEDPHA